MTTNSRDFRTSKVGDDGTVDGGRGGDTRGAGGKVLRGRRIFRNEAFPYVRSKEPSPTPRSPQVETRGWFSGFISGSRRILTSTFLFDNYSCSSSSYDSDSEIEEDQESDDFEDASDTNGIAMDQLEAKPDLIESAMAEPQILDSPSQTKISIEKLLQKETYSRDESKRLMEIIESRVVEPPTAEEAKKQEMGADYAPSTRLLGLPRQNFLNRGSPCSPSYSNTFTAEEAKKQEMGADYAPSTRLLGLPRQNFLNRGSPCSPSYSNTFTAEEAKKQEMGADYAPSTRLLGLPRQNFLNRGSPCSPSYSNTFNPSSSTDLVRTPHTSSAAIMEAKKWVEKKRLTSNFKSHLSFGPSTLNTDFFHKESYGVRGSPGDLAQSYIHALPAWRSPITGSIGFTTPSAGQKRSHIDVDGSGDAMNSSQIEHQRTEEKSFSPIIRHHDSTIKVDASAQKITIPVSNRTNEHLAASAPLPSKVNVQNASLDHVINVTSLNQVVDMEEQGGNNSVGVMSLLEQHKASGLLEDALPVEPVAVLSENITSTLSRYIDGSHQIHKTTNLFATMATSSGISHQHQLGSEARDNMHTCSNDDTHGGNTPLNETHKLSLHEVGGILDGINKQQPETMRSIKQMLRKLPPDSSNGRVKKTVARGRRGGGRGRGRVAK